MYSTSNKSTLQYILCMFDSRCLFPYNDGLCLVVPAKSKEKPQLLVAGVHQIWLPDTFSHQTTFTDEFEFLIKRAGCGKKQLLLD